jgi:hypothetical protein
MTTYLLFSLTMLPISGDGLRRSLSHMSGILSPSLFTMPSIFLERQAFLTMCFIVMLVAMEWASRNGAHGLAWLGTTSARSIRWTVYVVLLMLVLMFSGSPYPFIYGKY